VKRRNLLIALGAGLAMPLASFAQQQGQIRRIGFLSTRSRPTPQNPDPYQSIFVQAMHKLGHVEGKNLAIEWRFADGKYERLSDLAVELVQAKVEVIVTHFSGGAVAAQRATNTIPIVSMSLGDPVALGLAASLGRPGGNVTGLSLIVGDIYPKQLELLRAILPKVKRVAILSNPGSPSRQANLKIIGDAAQRLGISIVAVEAGNPQEIERGFATIARDRAEAVVVLSDSVFAGYRRQIVEATVKHRLPSVFYYREDTQAGGLMSYGQDIPDYYRRAAVYVDKILKGAKPADLPIEQPTTIHLAINRKTAKVLGITIPQELLVRADEVIE
jgi:putative ABC transport system substrate-binding protein